MSWFVLVIISVIFFSVSSVLQRVILKEEQSDPLSYAAIFQLLVGVAIFVFTLFRGFSLPSLSPFIFNLILMTALYALFNVSLFKAYKLAEASEIAVLRTSKTMWMFFGGIIFFREKLEWSGIFGLLMVLTGVLIVLWKREQKWKLSQGHGFALLASFCLAGALVNDAFLIKHFDVPSYTVLSFFLTSFVLFLINPVAVKKLRLFFDLKRLAKLLFTGVFYAVG